MKLRLARSAAWIERRIDLLIWRKHRIAGVIEPYIGYATPDHLVVRGRVLSTRRMAQAHAGQSRWTNLIQMLRLFVTDEVAHVQVTAGPQSTETDEEGYFTLRLPRTLAQGWTEVEVQAGNVRAICPVMIGHADAAFGVISEIDDTQMQTGAYRIWRNIWTSLTGNALTRKVFPDAVALMTVLHAGGCNPVFYVSSSPWNFHSFLTQVFARAGSPRGPMFLRDYGISETQFITGTHGDHKGTAIDRVLAASPDIAFVLIGDTGQHDAQVYHDAVLRHAGRVAHVVLRVAGGVDQTNLDLIAKIRAAGVPVTVGTDYADAITAFS